MIRKNDWYVVRTVYGKTILMPIRKNKFYDAPIVLNTTARAILDFAENCQTQKQLFELCCSHFQIAADSENGEGVYRFVQQLFSAGILIEEV